MPMSIEARAKAGARLKAAREAKKEQRMSAETQGAEMDYLARIRALEAQNNSLTAQIENSGTKVALPPGIGTRRLVGYVRARPEQKWQAAQMIVDADIYHSQFINKCDKLNLDQYVRLLQDGEEVTIQGWPTPPPTIVGAMDYARTGSE